MAIVPAGRMLVNEAFQATAPSAAASNSAIVAFAIYIALVLLLAWLSSRVTKKGSFLSEYFLGGRNLGMWAFALTFAATSASGGSFIGFPSMVYTHGWSVALWISSYMLMPLVALGLLAKRLNQLARKTDSITIPDLIRARFCSPVFGLIATLLIVFFMSFNLIAQFKGGSVILQTLLSDVPLFQAISLRFAEVATQLPFVSEGVDPSYLLCLCVFALAVVLYTTYGGFRAVVWTDVLQGLVMVCGVMMLLPMTLAVVGGLQFATVDLSKSQPPTRVDLKLQWQSSADRASLSYLAKNSLIVVSESAGSEAGVYRLAEPANVLETGRVVAANASSNPAESEFAVEAIQLPLPVEKIVHEPVVDGFVHTAATSVVGEYRTGAGKPGVYTSLPGPSGSDVSGFLPISIALSFFFYWCFASAGQPSNMIRCMAFKDSKTLSRAIITVSVYYSLIYFPIVVIFCCARTLLPGWETESDRIMPEMARVVTASLGVPWLAGLLVAAPFAAVMSTMDSFLLMISSAVVRDIYQSWIHPHPSEGRIKFLTYSTTFAVGIAAMIAAINPPVLLQDIIVFTGAGLATSFLAPVGLALYWQRFNHQGAIAGMLSGFLANIVLYAIGTAMTGKVSPYQPWNLHPFLIGLAISLLVSVVVCLITAKPDQEIVHRFFYRRKQTVGV